MASFFPFTSVFEFSNRDRGQMDRKTDEWVSGWVGGWTDG